MSYGRRNLPEAEPTREEQQLEEIVACAPPELVQAAYTAEADPQGALMCDMEVNDPELVAETVSMHMTEYGAQAARHLSTRLGASLDAELENEQTRQQPQNEMNPETPEMSGGPAGPSGMNGMG